MMEWMYYSAVTGTVFILAILALRSGFKAYLPRRVFVLLCTAAVLLLLVPFRIPSPVSVYNLLPAVPGQPAVLFSGGDTPSPLPPHEIAPSHAEQASSAVQSIVPKAWPDNVLITVWLAGAIVLLLLLASSYFVSFYRLRHAELVKGARAFWGAWCRVRVYRSDQVRSPMVIGALFPRIVLPSSLDLADSQMVDYIVEHELTHVRRFDNLLKLAAALAVCVHWFNPAAWYLYRTICRDIELSCDEAVLASFGPEKRSAYIQVMIGAAERFAAASRLRRAGEVFVMFGENDVKARVLNVMKYRRMSAATFLLALLLFAGTTAVFATTGKPEAQGAFRSASVPVSLLGAQEIALARAGGGDVVKLEYKVDKRGFGKYEAEISNASYLHKYEIDAETGRLFKYDRKPPKETVVPIGDIAIGVEEAERLAQEKAGGGRIVKFKLDRDKEARVRYDIHIVREGIRYEYKIDAATGEFFGVKQETIR